MNIQICIIFSVLLVVSSVRSLSCIPNEQLVIRQTTNGPVEGTVLTSSLGHKYYAFMGIPFAEPPITGKDPYTGQIVDRRFKATVPLRRKWKYPLKANKMGPSCIPTTRNLPLPQEMSEDCLFLNIYVPANGCCTKTVLVWIFGGGFALGDTDYGFYAPNFLLSEDNVVVTINYRIGIFGFLDLDCDEYSGNMGLKDQQLALKWIYENIENFAGKKDEILLFGQSAGAASTQFHILNKESQKYFNRAFMMSSSALTYYALNPAGNLDKIQECTHIYDTKKLIAYLKSANSSDLTKCCPYYFTDDRNITWVPTVERPTVPRAFLTKLPEDIYNSGEAPAMDAMFGFTSKEYSLWNAALFNSTVPVIINDLWKTDIQLPFRGFDKYSYPKEYLLALGILGREYFSGIRNTNEVAQRNVALMSDLTISESVLRAAVYQTDANNKQNRKYVKPNTYLFRFSLKSVFSLAKSLYGLTYSGAGHIDDVCYYFRCNLLNPAYDNLLMRKDKSYYDIKRMVKIITNFARTGNPSIEGDTPFIPNRSGNEIFCQEISNPLRTSVIYNIKEQLHYKAWREIEDIYRKYIKC